MSDTFEWNNYIICRPAIGRGSFSKVYRGYHKTTKNEVALKKIQFSKLDNNVKDKVVSEINILQKMDHINIMKMYEYKFDGDYIMIITEYCTGGDLEQWMKTNHTNYDKENIIQQIVTGMDYLHSNNIHHRDIKPQNILLHNNIVKICDFGFSIVIKEHNMMFNTICGTPLFMSPELLFMKPYTIMSEIWALGVLFYMIIYHCHPHGRLMSLDDYRMKIKNSIGYPLAVGMEHILEIIKIMLHITPERRPTINNINKMLNRIPLQEPLQEEIKENKLEIVEEQPILNNNNMSRINELEQEVFRLENIIKEKPLSSSFTCCFDSETDDVTGRGRTNNGYESVDIDNEYFTPPKTNAINIPRKNSLKINSSPHSFNSGSLSEKNSSFGSVGKNKSFLSSSIDKITAFFSLGRK